MVFSAMGMTTEVIALLQVPCIPCADLGNFGGLEEKTSIQFFKNDCTFKTVAAQLPSL
jgi:hypothetical protein